MNPGNRQNRPKPERRARTARVSQAPYQPYGTPDQRQQRQQQQQQQQAYAPVRRNAPLLDRMVVLDKSSAYVPAEMQRAAAAGQGQARPQYVNLEPQAVRQPAPHAGSVQILQNIAIRPSGNGGAAPGGQAAGANGGSAQYRRYVNQGQPPAGAAPTFVVTQPVNINPRLARSMPTMIPPGGQFAVQRNAVGGASAGQQSGGPVAVQRSASSASLSLLQEKKPNTGAGAGAGGGVAAAGASLAPHQHGRLPMFVINDYPEFKVILHEYGTQHKNMMFRMSGFIHALFNPLLTSPGYVLIVSVNYTDFICLEVDAKVFGDFMCRLLPRMLEMRNVPFVLEVKDAPCHWARDLKKSIVIGKNNFELAARKIAECFRNCETTITELPERLELQFTVRRTFFGIKFAIGRESVSSIRSDFSRRLRIADKAKGKKGKVECGTQSELECVLPGSLVEQHEMQLELVVGTQARSVRREAALVEHTRRMEMNHRVQIALIDGIVQKVNSLVEGAQPRTVVKQEFNWGNCRVKEVQTDAPPPLSGYGPLSVDVIEPMLQDDFDNMMEVLLKYMTMNHQQTLDDLEKLQQENDALREDLAKRFKREDERRRSERRCHRDKKARGGKDEKKGEVRRSPKRLVEVRARSGGSVSASSSSSSLRGRLGKKSELKIVSMEEYTNGIKGIRAQHSLPLETMSFDLEGVDKVVDYSEILRLLEMSTLDRMADDANEGPTVSGEGANQNRCTASDAAEWEKFDAFINS